MFTSITFAPFRSRAISLLAPVSSSDGESPRYDGYIPPRRGSLLISRGPCTLWALLPRVVCAMSTLRIDSFLASLDKSFDEARAECDAARAQHGEWLTQLVQNNQSQLLYQTCAPLYLPLCQARAWSRSAPSAACSHEILGRSRCGSRSIPALPSDWSSTLARSDMHAQGKRNGPAPAPLLY